MNGIARTLQVNRSTVRRWQQAFDEGGVDALLRNAPRGRSRPVSRTTAELILHLANEGNHITQRHIAAQAGVSQATVCRVLKQQGHHRRGHR